MIKIIVGDEYDVDDPKWGRFRGVVEEVDGLFVLMTVTKGPATHKYLPAIQVRDRFWLFVDQKRTKMEPVT